MGRALRQLRVESGLSQSDLAARANISRSAVQHLESGAGSRLESVIRVLAALGRLDALDELRPSDGPTPLELLRAQRRAARTTARLPRVRRS
ncbi:helix-turn-helix transcriptional regulator [Mesorhizobium japonicum]|uniref:helix-turn-helix transcriptional regulator n=1 Tax=Mesorhizobium japonicum TaxID=2066070 RepID=UPI003B5C7EC6